jgi:hypothetical protein
MNFTKKGQAAMEFLMTYGWALLVVLIAIAALAFFGLLNPSRFLPERCEIAPGLTCMDFNAKTDKDVSIGDAEDNITILLNNGIGQVMKGVQIEISDCNNEGGEMTPIPVLVEGQTQKVEISCGGMVPNTRFRSNMIIRYNTSIQGEDLPHSKSGYIVVQVDKI